MIKTIFLLSAIVGAIVYVVYLIYAKKHSYVKYSIIALMIFVSAYNILQTNNENYAYSIVLAFNNNKKIICNDIEITKTNFNLVTGTSVFLGKLKSPYNSYVFPVETCKVGD